MRLRKLIAPVLTLAAVGGLAAAGYATRDRWLPHVFPGKPAARSGDGHGHAEGDGHAGHDHAHDHTDRVAISPQAQANLGLDKDGAVEPLTPQEYWRKLTIPGVVVDRPGESDRGVTSRVAGIVTEVKARPGDTVRAGEPLFTVQLVSEFLQATQTDLARTSKELAAAVVRRDQTAKLVKAGTKPGIELTEDENAVKRLATQVQGYRRQLLVFGLTTDQVDKAERGDVVTEATVTAPTAPPANTNLVSAPPGSAGEKPADLLYEVQELKVQLGEQVQAGQTLCLLANHQRLFVEGRAFKSEATALAAAAENKVPVEAEFADEPPGSWPTPAGPLLVHHLSNQVDPQTRTFAFYLPLENQSRTFTRDGKTYFVWRFRPGQRVRLRVPVEKLGDGVLVLPAGAVVREGPEAFVFVQSGDTFRRKPVRVLYEDRTEVVLASDITLTAGQFVVRTPAAAALQRALKAAGGEGGGHDHHGHSHDH